MRIDSELVRSVARLAALDLVDGEDARLADELTRIVEHFEVLRAVPDDVLPPLPQSPPTPLREDLAPPGPVDRPFVAGNAPETLHGHFVVPRVVSRNG